MKNSVVAMSAAFALCAACAGPDQGARNAANVPLAPVVTATGVASPSSARVGTHVDTTYGVAVPDPYRWLEETTAAEARTWVAAQERYAAAVLARGIGQDSLTTLYANVYRDAPTLGRVVELPAGLTMTRWLGDAPSLFVAAVDASGERLLMSAEAITKTFKGNIREIMPSSTGQLLAIGTTAAGDSGGRDHGHRCGDGRATCRSYS